MLLRALLVLLSAAPLFSGDGIPLQPPLRGFEQNVGQFSSDVLFGLEQRILYRDRIQLSAGISIRFLNANPSPTVTGEERRPFPLNRYFGSDPKKWLEDVPHFKTIRYGQVNPGIDVQFIADWIYGGGTRSIRIVAAPGANLGGFGISVLTDQPTNLTVLPDELFVRSTGFTLDNLIAYQTIGGSQHAMPVTFVQINDNSFRPQVGSYDPSIPLIIEFGDPFGGFYRPDSIIGTSDDAVVSAAWTFYTIPSFVAKNRYDGTPVFLTLFSPVSYGRLISDQQGNITIAARFNRDTSGTLGAAPPVTQDAPRFAPNSNSDGWLARFDSTGKLVSATYAGNDITNLIAGQNAAAYFSTAESIVKWNPGTSQFAFVAPIAQSLSLATNASGELAFVATGRPGLPTTPGAVQSTYQGRTAEYAGRLDPVTGAILMATYVGVIGLGAEPVFNQTLLGLAPNGSLWLASQIIFNNGSAHTLVALRRDGSGVIVSDSVPYTPAALAFDTDGNPLVLASVSPLNLPTSLDAPLRVPCAPSLYLAKKSVTDGALLYATYIDTPGPISTFDGLDRLFAVFGYPIPEYVVRLDTTHPTQPAIGCIISPATRQFLNDLALDELVTISGHLLGPLQSVAATLDASGNLPRELGGIEVLINGAAMPLAAVQQGMITFYVPKDTPASTMVPLEVRSRAVTIASKSIWIPAQARFAIFAADGSGGGYAAGLNQDGTIHPDTPAPLGSIISIFGIGAIPSRILAGNVPAEIEYAGPAPGLVPGIKQVTFRIPDNILLQRNTDFVRITTFPGSPSGLPVYLNLSKRIPVSTGTRRR